MPVEDTWKGESERLGEKEGKGGGKGWKRESRQGEGTGLKEGERHLGLGDRLLLEEPLRHRAQHDQPGSHWQGALWLEPHTDNHLWSVDFGTDSKGEF